MPNTHPGRDHDDDDDKTVRTTSQPLPAPAQQPLDAYKIPRRIRCGCGQVHVEDVRYDHKYTPMHCMGCGQALNLDLITHSHEREYFCPEHCRGHEWKATQYWASHCQCCGLDELTYRRAEVAALNEQVENLQRRLMYLT